MAKPIFYAKSSSSAFASMRSRVSKPSVNQRVDRGEEGARFGALALIAPQAREARRGAQLERARPLLAGDGEGAVIAGGGLVGGAAGREEQVAVEAMEVGVEERLARLCGDGEGGRDRALRLGELAGGSLRFGQNGKERGRTAWFPVSAASARPSRISGSAPGSPATTRAAAWNARPTPSHRGKPCASLSAITSAARSRCAATSRRNQWTTVSKKSANARLNGSSSRRARATASRARASAASGWPRCQRFHAAIAQRRDALIAAEHPDEPVVLRRIVERDRPLAVRERGRELPLVVLGDRDVSYAR